MTIPTAQGLGVSPLWCLRLARSRHDGAVDVGRLRGIGSTEAEMAGWRWLEMSGIFVDDSTKVIVQVAKVKGESSTKTGMKDSVILSHTESY